MKPILFYGRFCLLLTLLFLFSNVHAQKTKDQIEKQRQSILADGKVKALEFSEERQTPSLLVFNYASITKDQLQNALSNYVGAKQGENYLVAVRSIKQSGNMEMIEYQQYYKGVKVDRATFKVLLKDGKAVFSNGAFYEVPSTLSTLTSISEEQALSKARGLVNAKKYAWEQVQEMIRKATDVNTKAALQKELNEYLPKAELVIIKDFSQKGVAEVQLAYKFNIYAADPISRAWVYVDAHNGKILLYDRIIKHLGDPGKPPGSVNSTVQTRYAGNQMIKTKQISGTDPNSGLILTSSHPTTEVYIPGSSTYVLIDDTRGGGIETYDLNGIGGLPLNVSAVYLQGKSFTDADNNWTFSEHHRSPSNDGAFEAENDDIAFDAHWGAEVVYDYWLVKHNRLSYDGNNTSIRSFVHYGPAYDNAFWNGSVMTYGDGSGPTAGGFKALTSLDVCGHEIGHGVCSSTSDLVYAGESGAMNEGLSDIWSSCIEHFAMTRSGSTVPSTAYRPFYIGEQIGADYNSPLRRMDNPKQQGNPDTYGGTNWINPDCSPNLVNDECGVHTNSGILNHWFFLLTAGSKSGVRPAGMTPNQYYFGDSDDELNDLGNRYVVNGVGFDVAEQITFLMETMLSSTATYAEARDVSVQVVIALSGDACSNIVESVTNAWYAVGVGEQFVKPCASQYGFISQSSSVSEANTAAGCTSEKTISIPILMPANSTATITAKGTATSGLDYTLSTTSLSNATSTNAKQNISVVIKNDAVVENDENIVLNIAINNTGSNPVATTHTVTIMDDDVVPVIGNDQKSLVNESFTGADGTNPNGWSEILQIAETNGDPAATGKNHWSISGNQLAVTGKEGLTNTAFPAGTYNNLSESHTILRSPLIDARGLSLLTIKFNYEVQGEVDLTSGSTDIENLPVFDYMAVGYSLDGVHFVELNSDGFRPFAAATPTSGTFSGNLPVSLANKQFYIGFVWYNDGNAGGPGSAIIDNLELKGSPRKIEKDLNQNGREILGAGQEVYFYSNVDGELLGKVKNNSTNNFGCTNLYLEKTGTGAFNLYQDKNGLHKVSDKVLRIEPGAMYKASQTVTLYYTEAQLQGLEAATGQSRTTFSVYVVSAASYNLAANNNTKKYAATYTAIPGVGGYYTFTFTDRITGSFALGCQVSILGTGTARETVTATQLNEGWKFGNLYPNPGNGNAVIGLKSPKPQQLLIEVINIMGQVVHTQKEMVNAGSNVIQLRVRSLSSGNYFVRMKDDKGTVLNNQQYQRE